MEGEGSDLKGHRSGQVGLGKAHVENNPGCRCPLW